jgi:hypothetical protein
LENDFSKAHCLLKKPGQTLKPNTCLLQIMDKKNDFFAAGNQEMLRLGLSFVCKK